MTPWLKGRRTRRTGRALPLALAFAMVMGAVAWADVVHNDVTSPGGIVEVTAGGAGATVTYSIEATGGDSTDPTGSGSRCNAADGTPATVTPTGMPAGVTSNPTEVNFTDCSTAKGISFAAGAAAVPGDYIINVTVTDSGAVAGDYNTIPARFTLRVVAAVATNQAPSTPGKPSATSPNKGGFTLSWTASTDDGLPNPPATVTYALEGKDADDTGFASIANDFSGASFTFGDGQPAEGTWTYRVQASDSALTSDWSDESDPIVVDRTAPTFGDCPAGGPFLLNSGDGSETVGPITADDGTLPDGSDGSGVDASSSTLSGSVDTTSVGSKNVTFTALDNAGNSDTKVCSYSVTYDFIGFFAPVNNGNFLNSLKAGQAIPLKWRLLDANGDPVTNLTSAPITVVSLACNVGSTVDQLEETAAGGSGLQNLGDGYYQLNWKSPSSYANSCKTLRLNLGEGIFRTADFQFRK